jgi:aspartate/methionine/tyrosine aminotransferase
VNLPLAKVSSLRATQFNESVIRETSRLASQYDAINLGQGVPDFPCPEELKAAACAAIAQDINQYAITWGDRLLRQAIAVKAGKTLGRAINAETEITVACGATEAMVATMFGLLDPLDEVIVFSPFYENYGPEAILCGNTLKFVKLQPPAFTFDERELAHAFNDKTRAIIVNSPHNPTGKVFGKDELKAIARLCQKWGVLAITDEIYEHIIYDGAKHIAIGSLPGMEELTVTINSLSKTYSLTGWRVGWAIARPDLTTSIRKVHDFLTVGAPAPLQRAGVAAISMPQKYYDELIVQYDLRRRHMLETLDLAGIPYFKPQGAYYVFSDVSQFGFADDVSFTKHLIEKVGVAVVPGSGFVRPATGQPVYVRFCFSRRLETLEEARRRLTAKSLRA